LWSSEASSSSIPASLSTTPDRFHFAALDMLTTASRTMPRR
jgi:hypothetical protein